MAPSAVPKPSALLAGRVWSAPGGGTGARPSGPQPRPLGPVAGVTAAAEAGEPAVAEQEAWEDAASAQQEAWEEAASAQQEAWEEEPAAWEGYGESAEEPGGARLHVHDSAMDAELPEESGPAAEEDYASGLPPDSAAEAMQAEESRPEEDVEAADVPRDGPPAPEENAPAAAAPRPTAVACSRGVLKMFNVRRNFGFISPVLSELPPEFSSECGEGLWFFGAPSLPVDEDIVGREVRFEICVGGTGKPQATNVELTYEAATEAPTGGVHPEAAVAASPSVPSAETGVRRGPAAAGASAQGPAAIIMVRPLPDLAIHAVVVSELPSAWRPEDMQQTFRGFGPVAAACILPAGSEPIRVANSAGAATPQTGRAGCVVFSAATAAEAATRRARVLVGGAPGEGVLQVAVSRFSSAVKETQALLRQALAESPPAGATPAAAASAAGAPGSAAAQPSASIAGDAAAGQQAIPRPRSAFMVPTATARLVGTVLPPAGDGELRGRISCPKLQGVEACFDMANAPDGAKVGAVVSFELENNAQATAEGEPRAARLRVLSRPQPRPPQAPAVAAPAAAAVAAASAPAQAPGSGPPSSGSSGGESHGNTAAGAGELPPAATGAEAPSNGHRQAHGGSRKSSEKDVYHKCFPCRAVARGKVCTKGEHCPDAHSLAEVQPLPDTKPVRKVAKKIFTRMAMMAAPPMAFGMMPPGVLPMWGAMPGMGVPLAPPAKKRRKKKRSSSSPD